MGASESQIPKDDNLPIFVLSITPPDVISLINAPQAIGDITYVTINACWSAQLQSHNRDGGEETFQLAGWPLMKGCSYQTQVEMRNLFVELVKNYFKRGWKLLLTIDLTQRNQLGTYFFVYSGVTEPRNVVCVSQCGLDSVSLIRPTALLQVALEKATGYEVDLSDQSDLNLESFVAPNTWLWADEEVGVTLRKFLLELISQFDMAEYVYYGKLNLQGQADSLLFIERPVEDYSDRSQNQFFILSLAGTNKVRIISSPQNISGDELVEVVNVVRLILNNWPGGIKGERNFYGSFEFKLGLSPWWAEGTSGILSRTFLTEMFERLSAEGWALHSSLELCRKNGGDKSAFIFKKSPRRQLHHICLAFVTHGNINLIRFPPTLIEGLREIIKLNWPAGIYSEGPICGCQQLKLSNSSNGYHSNENLFRNLVAHMLAYLMDRGYFILASADVCSQYQGGVHISLPQDLQAIWLVQAEGVSSDSAPPTYEETILRDSQQQ